MHYYPILDAAPSSVSSTAVSLAGSLFSLLGSIYVMISLNMLRKNTDADARKTWQSRHYLIFALACVNFVMSSSALISGSFFLVYGRISSAVGCTIGGMIEFWAQQADNACIIFIALVVYASVFKPSLWTQRRYWVQVNAAPVIGLIIFLPLVATIVSQIIWRFHSEELPYCWIPRVPVYARWVAIDGWRFLLVVGLILAYSRIAHKLFRKERMDRPRELWLEERHRPVVITVPQQYSAIDSALVSNATNDSRGLLSQSLYTIQKWAMSRLGRSNADGVAAPRGLRANAGSAVDEQSSNYFDIPQRSRRNSITIGVAKASRNYYEQLKQSFVNLIVRRFIITTDIPSPTISEGIFDNICKSHCAHRANDGCEVMSMSATHCDVYSSTEFTADYGNSISSRRRMGISRTQESLAAQAGSDSNVFVARFDDYEEAHGLKRWCSALSRLITKPSRQKVATEVPAYVPPFGYALRRSHTAPTLSTKQMDLCNSAFARPGTPRPAHSTVPARESTETSTSANYRVSQTPSPITAPGHCISPSRGIDSACCDILLSRESRNKRENNPITDDSNDSDTHVYAFEQTNGTGTTILGNHVGKPKQIFGPALTYTDDSNYIINDVVNNQPQIGIYTFKGTRVPEGAAGQESFSMYSDESAHIVGIEGIGKLSSLEEGNWASAVKKCRSDRLNATASHTNVSIGQLEEPSGRISRLYVYPLAYVFMWIPSLVYYVLSTYVYYTAFESPNGILHSHGKRAIDASNLPAHWTGEQNMHKVWPYYQHATTGIPGSSHLSWLAIIQALHLLNGAIDAILFWLTEHYFCEME